MTRRKASARSSRSASRRGRGAEERAKSGSPRDSIDTLGVADVAKARAFYERLGFEASAASQPTIAFMQGGGVVLSLFSRAALAEDATVENSKPGFAGITLAYTVASEADVAAFIDQAVASGARLVKPAHKAFWGGFSGYFADPDGHLWEVAHNPHFPLDADGRIQLPPPA